MSESTSTESQDKIQNSDGKNSSTHQDMKEEGFCWIDLSPVWEQLTEAETGVANSILCHAPVWPVDAAGEFDDNGDLIENSASLQEVGIL